MAVVVSRSSVSFDISQRPQVSKFLIAWVDGQYGTLAYHLRRRGELCRGGYDGCFRDSERLYAGAPSDRR